MTVLTKPWPCASACLYCPNDIRMPKSYLADEPACQRAERNWFDPYLQVALRLRTLADMGHTTDKVELIVLGGTWTDYPREYRFWFTRELFRALNEASDANAQRASIAERRAFLRALRRFERARRPRRICSQRAGSGHSRRDHLQPGDSRTLRERCGLAAGKQKPDGRARRRHPRTRAQHAGHASLGGTCHRDTPRLHHPRSAHRNEGTRRNEGANRLQSLDQHILDANLRRISLDRIGRAFELARLFGFKIHAHFMANLYRATPRATSRGTVPLSPTGASFPTR